MIEKSDFDRLVGRIEEIAEHIRKGENRKPSGDTERWISNKEAMGMLGISPRTLQRYRDNGCIPFSKIGRTAATASPTSSVHWKRIGLTKRRKSRTVCAGNTLSAQGKRRTGRKKHEMKEEQEYGHSAYRKIVWLHHGAA